MEGAEGQPTVHGRLQLAGDLARGRRERGDGQHSPASRQRPAGAGLLVGQAAHEGQRRRQGQGEPALVHDALELLLDAEKHRESPLTNRCPGSASPARGSLACDTFHGIPISIAHRLQPGGSRRPPAARRPPAPPRSPAAARASASRIGKRQAARLAHQRARRRTRPRGPSPAASP